MKKTLSLAAIVAFGLAAPAFAWKAYHLEGNTYTILCADGTIHSYTGSGSGISISGDALCEGHGGIAGGGGGPVGGIQQATPVKAKPAGGGMTGGTSIDPASPTDASPNR